MQQILDFFRDKRVFITGHTGFKGSWLAFALAEANAKVLGFALPPSGVDSHFELLDLKNRVIHTEGDIRDGEFLLRTMREFNPEVVFHLAAQALVRKSYEDPGLTYSTNVIGSLNLLEAVRATESVKSLIYVTSDKCYENHEWLWGYRENDELGGHDPYSSSKASAELLFSTYLRSYFQERPTLGAASVRAGNVIGGGDWAQDRIIPDFVRALENDKPIVLRNPNATRPWQHVLEPLSGYLKLSTQLLKEPKKFSGSWNFGPTTRDVITVEQMVKILISEFNQGSIKIGAANNGIHEAGLLQLNCDKAHNLLNWFPTWDSNSAIRETALWYKEILSGKLASEITRSQISKYFKESK